MTPDDLLYAKTHEWVRLETDDAGGKLATVGLTAFAVEALTDIVFLDLPEVGRTVRAGEPLGVVESVKAVSDIYSPVAGEVVQANQSLPDRLELLSSDPYGEGWIAKIRLGDESGLASLLDAKAYAAQCAEEGGH